MTESFRAAATSRSPRLEPPSGGSSFVASAGCEPSVTMTPACGYTPLTLDEIYGKVLAGPAAKPLERRDPPA